MSPILPKLKLAFFTLCALFFGLGGTGLLSMENHDGRVGSWLAAMIGYYFIFGALFGFLYRERWRLAVLLAWTAVLLGVYGLATAPFRGLRQFLIGFTLFTLPAASALFGSWAAPRLWRDVGFRLRKRQ